MSFTKYLREAKKAPDVKGKLIELNQNDLMSRYMVDLDISATKFGDIDYKAFEDNMRQGNVRKALDDANPNFKLAEEDTTFLEALERESSEFPDNTALAPKQTGQEVETYLDDGSGQALKDNPDMSAEDLEELRKTSTKLDTLITSIDDAAKKNGSGGLKKYLLVGGVAVVSSAIAASVIHSITEMRTGCFLYTKTDGETACCKVLYASCMNPNVDEAYPTCGSLELPENLEDPTLCDGWDENSPSACRGCTLVNEIEDPEYETDGTELLYNQYIECREQKSIIETLGDLVYAGGIAIGDALSTIGNILRWVVIIVVIVLIIYFIYWIFTRNKSEEQEEEQEEEFETRAAAKYDVYDSKDIANIHNDLDRIETFTAKNSAAETAALANLTRQIETSASAAQRQQYRDQQALRDQQSQQQQQFRDQQQVLVAEQALRDQQQTMALRDQQQALRDQQQTIALRDQQQAMASSQAQQLTQQTVQQLAQSSQASLLAMSQQTQGADLQLALISQLHDSVLETRIEAKLSALESKIDANQERSNAAVAQVNERATAIGTLANKAITSTDNLAKTVAKLGNLVSTLDKKRKAEMESIILEKRSRNTDANFY